MKKPENLFERNAIEEVEFSVNQDEFAYDIADSLFCFCSCIAFKEI